MREVVSRHRVLVIFGLIGLAGFLIFIVVAVRVQKGLAPGGEIPFTQEEQEPATPELKAETVAENLTHVWDIGFLPDDTLIFTERGGSISKLSNGQKVELYSVENVYAVGEGGLLGMAVDPKFNENRFIYACYDTINDIRVSRWRVNEDASALEDQSDIVTGMPVNTTTFPGRHSGCRPRFGPEGYLWVGTGDVGIESTPQDPTSLGGKVLRIDRNGNPAPGNPGGEYDLRIFSYGHRNIQGMALFAQKQGDSYGYSVEHGPDVDDEINELVPGNFGWDPGPGYDEGVPMTDVDKFPDAVRAIWSSGRPTLAPAGATIVSGNKWGTYQDYLAVAMLKSQHVRFIKIDLAGGVEEELEFFKDEFGRIRTVVMGPDEDMFVGTTNGDGSDKIIKITPSL